MRYMRVLNSVLFFLNFPLGALISDEILWIGMLCGKRRFIIYLFVFFSSNDSKLTSVLNNQFTFVFDDVLV